MEMKTWSADKAHFLAGPRLDKQTGVLYARRFIDVAWMTLRTFPLLQTGQASFDGNRRRRWETLDQSMRLAVAARPFADAVSAAFVAMIDAKFSALAA